MFDKILLENLDSGKQLLSFSHEVCFTTMLNLARDPCYLQARGSSSPADFLSSNQVVAEKQECSELFITKKASEIEKKLLCCTSKTVKQQTQSGK